MTKHVTPDHAHVTRSRLETALAACRAQQAQGSSSPTVGARTTVQLHIPGSAQRRTNGSAYIDGLNLNKACSAVCDVCQHGRNSKVHRANRCSEKRQRAQGGSS